MIDVGARSSYVGTHFASRIMVPQESGLIVNISSAGAIRFFLYLAYGVGKAALDRITVEASRPLSRHGVAIVSLWPNLVKTERVLGIPGFELEGAESQRFTGRAVVALARDNGVMQHSGKALTSRGFGGRDQRVAGMGNRFFVEKIWQRGPAVLPKMSDDPVIDLHEQFSDPSVRKFAGSQEARAGAKGMDGGLSIEIL
jgi:NAD(P)-dependent dehydrogenase (short-subunit alcohol dehydrogenase family)